MAVCQADRYRCLALLVSSYRFRGIPPSFVQSIVTIKIRKFCFFGKGGG
jgi:hypothetical protein